LILFMGSCGIGMTTTRLSDSDKRQIVELYRQPGETTLTLADRYGVSNTTISRVLKSSLSPTEYEGLIQQKRSLRAAGDTPIQGNVLEAALFALEAAPPVRSRTVAPEVEFTPVPEVEVEVEAADPPVSDPNFAPEPERPTGKRVIPAPVRKPVEPPIRRSRQLEGPSLADVATGDEEEFELAPVLPTADHSDATAVEAIRDELIAANLLDHPEDDLDDDMEDELEEGLDDDDDDFDEADVHMPTIQLSSTTAFIKVLPITEASMPRTCYLVVDRSAELIARPLIEFGDLGQIPSAEIQEKTMPVFDNHRVAKRFSNPRTQRVIKVPDSRILQKTAPYLQAKGITRLLIEGQVYAL
jgi:hypothetical protein